MTPISLAAAAECNHDAAISEARVLLMQILGNKGGEEDLGGQVPWRLIRSGVSTLLWKSRNKLDAVLLKGMTSTTHSPVDVKNWLLENDLVTGIEGIVKQSDMVQIYNKSGGGGDGGGEESKMYLRRIQCKSGSILASKREFLVVTTVHYLPENGSYIIASRSVSDDFLHPPRKGKGIGALVTGETRRDVVRGVLHCSGFLLVPVPRSISGDVHCDISFAVHLDMLGSARIDQSRIDPLSSALLAVCNRLQTAEGQDDGLLLPRSRGSSLVSGSLPRRGSISDEDIVRQSQSSAESEKYSQNCRPFSSPSSVGSSSSPALPCLVLPGTELMSPKDPLVRELVVASRAAAQRICQLHTSFQSHLQERTVNPVASLESGHNPSDDGSRWSVFHEKDAILVGELAQRGQPAGVLAATCTVQAPPATIKKLLLEEPEAIDVLLEGRKVVNQVDDSTFVQWLAYRSIWPVGSRDFLLVTTTSDLEQDATTTVSPSTANRGFFIVSTSADSIVEDIDEGDDSSPLEYSRSTLRATGYVGVPTSDGGTSLTMIVDVDVLNQIPSWLVQVLAQYGLSEMLTRIKLHTSTNTNTKTKTNPSEFLEANPQGLDQQESRIDRLLLHLQEQGGAEEIELRGGSIALSNPGGHVDVDVDVDGRISGGSKLPTVRQETRTSLSVQTFLMDDSDGDEIQHKAPVTPVAPSPRSLLSMQSTPKTRPWEQNSGKLLAAEARQLMKIYAGIEDDPLHPLMDRLGIEWVEKIQRGKTKVFSCHLQGHAFKAFKSVTSFNVSKTDILDLLLDDTRIGEFDELFDSFEPIPGGLGQIDDQTVIRRMCFKAIWPTAPRDFLVLSTNFQLANGSAILASRSASNSLMPCLSGWVRGFIQVTGYYIQPYETLSDAERQEMPFLAPGGCKCTFVVHSELGGSVPSSITNMLGDSAPLKMMHALDAVLSLKKKTKQSGRKK